MFGLSVAILFFDNHYQTASPTVQSDDWQMIKVYLPSLPYSDKFENKAGAQGLIKKDGRFYNTTNVLHQNDTLYITLKSNLAAREQFFELASMMETVMDNSKSIPDNNSDKAIKLLSNLLKNYIPSTKPFSAISLSFGFALKAFYQNHMYHGLSVCELNMSTPPPESRPYFC